MINHNVIAIALAIGALGAIIPIAANSLKDYKQILVILVYN